MATKGTDIVVFKLVKEDSSEALLCLTCEIAPSCHTTPITSLQCINNKYVLTSSRAATQYFDIGMYLPRRCFIFQAGENYTRMVLVTGRGAQCVFQRFSNRRACCNGFNVLQN